MTAITNLYTRYSYPIGRTALPIVVLMHGWSDAASNFSQAAIERIANYGFFVVVPGMRSKDGASGTQDASAREIYDIYDAVVQARAHYPTITSSDKAAIVGYSGGGGNALAAACKFPDFWTTVVSHYGISDYGHDGTTGWYQTSAAYRATMVTYIGDTPTNVPDKYYARDARSGIINYTGGQVILIHDTEDSAVPIGQSQLLQDAMAAASMTNCTEYYSVAEDAVRWLHGYPGVQTPIAAELLWKDVVLAGEAWTVPTSGTITVIGYIKTKRFTIWLNTGLDAAATVVYDTVAGTYTVTPLTSNAVVAVTITQGALTASGNTNGATLFTVA